MLALSLCLDWSPTENGSLPPKSTTECVLIVLFVPTTQQSVTEQYNRGLLTFIQRTLNLKLALCICVALKTHKEIK